MKGKLVAILIFIACFFCNSQSLGIIYEVKFKPQMIKDSTSTEQMLLQIDLIKKESFYQSYNRLKYDSLTLEINKLGRNDLSNGLINSLPSYSFNHIIYKNLVKNNFEISENIMTHWYSSDFLFDPKWNLINGSKMIQNYNCNKAKIRFGGRQWIAWYTSEIPIQDGPYKFHGLPGLILELYSDDGDFQFTTIALHNTEIVKSNRKTTKLKAQQLNQLKKNIAKDPSVLLQQKNAGNLSFSMNVVFDGNKSTNTDKEYYDKINQEYWFWMKMHNNAIEKNDIWLQ